MTNHVLDVLVVDDDPFIRGFIQATLQSEGYTIATATNGREALDRIAERRPALILLDLSMPVMNGWQLLEHLRRRRTAIPVVFMTAGYHAREEAERHGADGYLPKPFDLDDLLGVVTHFTGDGNRDSGSIPASGGG